MDENKKNIRYIGIVVILILALFIIWGLNDSKGGDEQTATSTSENIQGDVSTATVLEEPKEYSENPVDQINVKNQPAYLIDAYTRHEKNYIGFDYVIVFKGDEAVKAKIEDGLCTNASDCGVTEGGVYIRNNNPHYRTYEVSTTTPLSIEASTALVTAFAGKGIQSTGASFNDLKEVVPTMPIIASSSFPYKDAKSLVYIDVKDGAVIKVSESKE